MLAVGWTVTVLADPSRQAATKVRGPYFAVYDSNGATHVVIDLFGAFT